MDPFTGEILPAITGSGVSLGPDPNSSIPSQVVLDYSIAQDATTGPQTLTLQDRFGTSNGETFTVGYPPATVTSVSPTTWMAGATNLSVTITGQNFGTAPTLPPLNVPGVSLTKNSSTPDGTTIQATATVAQWVSSTPVTVTVLPGYTGQNFYCVCPPAQANGTDTVQVLQYTAPPKIMFNGSNIAGTTQANPVLVMAGQQIYMTAVIPSGYVEQNQGWNISGNAIAGLNTPADGSASYGQVQPVTDTGQGSLLLYWLPTDTSGKTTATAAYQYCQDAAQSNCAQQTATFSVLSPTEVAMTASPGSAELYTTNDPESNYNGPVLGFGDVEYSEWGMEFDAQLKAPEGTPAIAQFVQIIISDNEKRLTSSGSRPCQSPSTSPALDKAFPYPPYTDLSANDSPTDGVLDIEGELQREIHARMFLMWDPQSACNTPQMGGGCSLFVPLGYIEWRFNGDAINTKLPQNEPNSPLKTTNNTTYTLNTCSGCVLPLPFVTTEGWDANTDPAWGYPQWTMKADFTDKCAAGTE